MGQRKYGRSTMQPNALVRSPAVEAVTLSIQQMPPYWKTNSIKFGSPWARRLSKLWPTSILQWKNVAVYFYNNLGVFWYVLQVVPVCLFEMAPTRLRGVFDIGFQCFTTSGILAANLINYGTNKIQGGSVTPSTSVQPYVCMFFTCAIFFSFIMDLIFYSLCSLAGYFFICSCMHVLLHSLYIMFHIYIVLF